MKKSFCAVILVAVLMAISISAQAVQYKTVDLGTMPWVRRQPGIWDKR